MTTGSNSRSAASAFEAMDAFFSALNTQDPVALENVINVPHMRIASGKVTTWNTHKAFGRYMYEFSKRVESRWHHSVFDSREVIHDSVDKVHVAVKFTRCDEAGNRLATYKSLWIVTCIDGHWGIQARSSFAA